VEAIIKFIALFLTELWEFPYNFCTERGKKAFCGDYHSCALIPPSWRICPTLPEYPNEPNCAASLTLDSGSEKGDARLRDNAAPCEGGTVVRTRGIGFIVFLALGIMVSEFEAVDVSRHY
jgi:hypothetical protein